MREKLVKSETGEQIAVISALLAIAYFIRHFRLEESLGLDLLILIVVPAFYISTFIKDQWKPALLTTISHIVIVSYFGLTQGALILGIGWLFFVITLLNTTYRIKLILVLSLSALLLLARLDLFSFNVSNIFIPVVASIFMFRLIVYMHELKYNNIKEGFWQRASYFFMLPNLFILLFPIVDYKTYTKNFFSTDRNKIYTKGLSWILLGAFQLVLYKLAYYYWVFPINNVENTIDAFNFVASNYGLFIRINGHFNIAMGILCLFGYNLPSPFYWFYFAPNFSEIWRRINTYWRDFVQKVFYYPMMFRYKKLGIKKSVIIAMLYSFFITYILHSYQWFWLRGDFLLTSADAAFWGIFGVLITLNSVYLLNKKRTIKSKTAQQLTIRKAFLRTAQTLGMFFTMAILIGLWSSPTVSEWLQFLPFFVQGDAGVWIRLLTIVGLILLVGTILQFIVRLKFWDNLNNSPVLFRSGSLAILALSTVYLDKTNAVNQLQPFFSSIKSEDLNSRDKMALTAGYYESVINVNRNLGDRLTEVEQMRPNDWEQLVKTSASKDTNNLLVKTLVANASIQFKDEPFNINQHGFRDKNYPTIKPDSTTRLALLGSSVELGSGVADNEVFETIAEKRLQDSIPDWNYEILNYSISGYGLIQHYQNTKSGSRIYNHQPDAVLIAIHTSDVKFIIRGMIDVLNNKVWSQDSLIVDLVNRAGLEPGMNEATVFRKMKPHLAPIAKRLLAAIHQQIESNGAKAVLIYIPESEVRFEGAENYDLMKMGKAIGFDAISLDGAYDYMEPKDLQVTVFDHHPNALAHGLMADKFFEVILENHRIFRASDTL